MLYDERYFSSHAFYRLGFYLLLASVLHILLAPLPLMNLSLPLPKQSKNTKDIILEKWDSNKRSIVTTVKSRDETSDAPARFGGEFYNRTQKETKSRQAGRFRASRPNQRANDSTDIAGSRELLGSHDLPSRNDPPDISDLLPFSAQPHALPSDIEAGADTILNTDPILYASFINRIADEVYDPWVQFARDAVDNITKQRKLSADVYVTKLQLVIDEKGFVTSVQLLKSCSIDELDDAPRKAFWEAKVFPHPPSQMFNDEGFARFTYEFHFHFLPSAFRIVPWI